MKFYCACVLLKCSYKSKCLYLHEQVDIAFIIRKPLKYIFILSNNLRKQGKVTAHFDVWEKKRKLEIK